MLVRDEQTRKTPRLAIFKVFGLFWRSYSNDTRKSYRMMVTLGFSAQRRKRRQKSAHLRGVALPQNQ